jgi:two-component system CheB/CheR fusion protein
VDFSDYKRATIQRRMQRRMSLHKLESAARYLQLLERDREEVLGLYRDILIHVTHFFREPESFVALKEVVFPRIVADRGPDQPLRVWVPGCSTGEEAYSLAIALLEFLGTSATTLPIQIFATDISDAAIERARSGAYPTAIESNVSPERLRRFFSAQDGGYRVIQPVRDMCVFARQDLTRDPPFSRLDLIVCRNVLIYLGPSLQKRLMGVFHYALKPNGFLMLGQAESIGSSAQYFAPERNHKIYRRKAGPAAERGDFQLGVPARDPQSAAPPEPERASISVEALANRYASSSTGRRACWSTRTA